MNNKNDDTKKAEAPAPTDTARWIAVSLECIKQQLEAVTGGEGPVRLLKATERIADAVGNVDSTLTRIADALEASNARLERQDKFDENRREINARRRESGLPTISE